MTNNKKNGFTLIETIVTLAIFSALVLAITGIAMSVIEGQRKAFVLQNIQETGRHVLEIMSREIRMGVLNMASGNSLTTLTIKNAYDEDIEYRFNGGTKLQRRCNSCADTDWQDLNDDTVAISGVFHVRKNEDPFYSNVSFVLRLLSNDLRVKQQTEINLQNTLSLRSYEVL